MTKLILINTFTLVALSISTMALAEQGDGHRLMTDHTAHMPTAKPEISGLKEGGQSSFAAIQEIVNLLMKDPNTDWNRVDSEFLRLHLIDMDNVTLRSDVATENIDGGARFAVT